MGGPFADNSALAGWARVLAVALLAALIAVSGAVSLPPLDRDEARFAQATAQMLESGDFVAIRFQDAERNKKPAGIHWLQAASVAAFSSAEARAIWAYRLPSVLGAALAAAFTCAAGSRLFCPGVGFLAGLLLAASPALAAEGAVARTDAMLLASVCAAQAALIRIYGAWVEKGRGPIHWSLLFWTGIGAGVLIKGPIVLIIVGLTVAGLSFRERSARWAVHLRPLLGAAILLVMIAPWAVAVGFATDGRFFTEAIGGDMLAKIGVAQESHSGPPGYHAALAFVLFWPAAALILPGIREAVRSRTDWASWFLLSWLVPSWLIFEAAATKLPHYALPLYPALAILAARGVASGAAKSWPAMRRFGAGLYAAIGLGAAFLIPLLAARYREDGAEMGDWSAAGLLALGVLVAAALFWRGRMRAASLAAIGLSAGFAMLLMGAVLPSLDRLTLSSRIDAAIEAAGLHTLADGAPAVALAGYYEPSAIFLLGTGTILTDGAGAAARLADEPGGAVVVESREEAAFTDALAEQGARAEAIATIAGVNYSNGRSMILTVYASNRAH